MEINSIIIKIQALADLVSAAYQVDVGVVNRDMIAIAGTGSYKKYIGMVRPKDSYVVRSIQSGECNVCENPKYTPQCYKCEFRDKCPFLMATYNPIISNGSVAACLMLLAANPQHRIMMTRKLDKLRRDLERITGIFSDAFLQNKKMVHPKLVNSEVDIILDSFEEALLTTDSVGRITHVNAAATRILECNANDIVGHEIKDIFSTIGYKWNPSKSQESKTIEVLPLSNKNDLSIYTKPILVKHKIEGHVFRFEKITSAKSFVNPILLGGKDPFAGIVGDSFAIRKTINEARKIANTGSTVLLQGETGTGKELFAKGIHEASYRCNGPFAMLNCSTLPENLLESEMFGYEEGAFTGAKKGGKIGKFTLAHNGTFFLDEIAELPLSLQAKLLRVLEDGRIERVGGVHTTKVDVRIIAATNRNLIDMVNGGTFRKDLYYRINVIPIDIPTLRERKEDIPLLIDYFMSHFCAAAGCSPKKLSPEVENTFMNYPWPGNVRELKSTIEYLAQISPQSVVTFDDLPKSMKVVYFQKIRENKSQQHHRVDSLKSLEKSALERALFIFGSTTEGKKKVAQSLGLSLTTLYRRLKYYNIEDHTVSKAHGIEETQVVVKYCGGCNSMFDRRELVDEFFRKTQPLGTRQVKTGAPAEITLIVNGCIRACADQPDNHVLAPNVFVIKQSEDLEKTLVQTADIINTGHITTARRKKV